MTAQPQVLLDPTAELAPVQRSRRQRPRTLEGLRVGVLDISKRRGDVFLDRIDELLQRRGFSVRRFRKPRFSIVAPVPLQQEIHAACDVVIEGLAD